MSKDGHFSFDMHGPKTSLDPFPKRQPKLCVTRVLDPHNSIKGKFGVCSSPGRTWIVTWWSWEEDEACFMGARSVRCLICNGIGHGAAQPPKPSGSSHPSLLWLH